MLYRKLFYTLKPTSLQTLTNFQSNKFATFKLSDVEEKTKKVAEKALINEKKEISERKVEIFAQNLNHVYRLEKKRKRRAKDRNKEFFIKSLTSKTPVKDTLKLFENYQVHDFDDENLASCLTFLAKILKVNGDLAPNYMDHTVI